MENTIRQSREWILWLDCLGGLTVGLLVLLLHSWLSQVEGLPKVTIIVIGIMNFAYGSYSLFVATREYRPLRLVKWLALANMAWPIVCLAILVVWYDVVTGIGILLVGGEGLYVAALGFAEWRFRNDLEGRRR